MEEVAWIAYLRRVEKMCGKMLKIGTESLSATYGIYYLRRQRNQSSIYCLMLGLLSYLCELEMNPLPEINVPRNCNKKLLYFFAGNTFR